MSAVKRKRATGTKFYAVRKGKSPGIYDSWDTCFQQVKGFSGAIFKSFGTRAEAQDFVGEKSVANATASTATKWYGVRAGRTPGVYRSWPEVQEQIAGWKMPQYRAFTSQTEAEHFVISNQDPSSDSRKGDPQQEGSRTDTEGTIKPNAKRARMSKGKKATTDDEEMVRSSFDVEFAPGEAPLREGTDDDFDANIILDSESGVLRYKRASEHALLTYEAQEHRVDAAIKIYTDGSSLGNGTSLSVSGVGVYFGPRDPRNISAALPGPRQTNQRAELCAILRALEVAPRNRKLVIYSDSNYAIKCVSEWFHRWRTNGWINSAKKPVENRDLVQKIIDLLEERYKSRHGDENVSTATDITMNAPAALDDYWNQGPSGVRFIWVKGHSQDPGNIAADSLAVAGAKEAKECLSNTSPR